MGFFKKIGKLTKKVNLRGAIRTVGKVASFVPVVGGVASNVIESAVDKAQQNSDNRKAQKQAEAEAQAQALALHQNDLKNSSGYVEALVKKENPNVKDILQGAVGGALTGVGGVLSGTKEVGQVGATVIDNSITTWLKDNALKVGLVVIALFGLIWGATKLGRRR